LSVFGSNKVTAQHHTPASRRRDRKGIRISGKTTSVLTLTCTAYVTFGGKQRLAQSMIGMQAGRWQSFSTVPLIMHTQKAESHE
jgi:hypothetical protein